MHRQRQATLLYYFASLDYLKGLKVKIDEFMDWLDAVMAQRKIVDTVGMRDLGWRINDTMANWSGNAWPHFKDMQLAVAKQISLRSLEIYSRTWVSSFDRGTDEISTLWMDPKQEEEYQARRLDLLDYSRFIDYVGALGVKRGINEQIFHTLWEKNGYLFPRLPKFRVRADVEVETGKKPPRTGVYVPRDDPFGSLQFGWRGGDDGVLGDMSTLNEFGREAVAAIGHEYLWAKDGKLNRLLKSPRYVDDFRQYKYVLDDPREIDDPSTAAAYLSAKVFFASPCKWYYVEMLDGEDEGSVEVHVESELRGRVEGGQPCIREGWWFTPARLNSRHYFKEGEIMPYFNGDYGSVIWQWDADQDTSKT